MSYSIIKADILARIKTQKSTAKLLDTATARMFYKDMLATQKFKPFSKDGRHYLYSDKYKVTFSPQPNNQVHLRIAHR